MEIIFGDSPVYELRIKEYGIPGGPYENLMAR